ncbi:MAG: adenylate/guanylate cyclase domain-containing protein [Actinobacteria bacterium]|nr:MAG: adenylate/guanylate cyclase domain-containing protein [Actinomycetota bacterium]
MMPVVPELPAGTVTFLFTDIEGSTRLLQELGEDYAGVLAEHRNTLRDAFARHGGVEVDTQGDAFFVAFGRARDAFAAAVEARDALDRGPVRVRMGLHTGEPLLTEQGYVGIDVHRAARIAAAGHGGQILVSQSTRDLVGPDGLRDLGRHRLKDLTAAERVYQLGDGEFPPLKSLNRTNLPIASTALIGRERELAELRDLFAGGARLVTITGAGGSGKTRLALQVAAELADAYPDGVFFVALAPIPDPGLVRSAVAQSTEVRQIEELSQAATFLLLDNFEHLLPAADNLASLLAVAPDVKLLVTSRVRLNLSEEREFPLEPLPQEDAVTFFLDRARAVRREVRLEPAVGDICRRLDGLPLALELAASRLKVLEPMLLLERLGRRLPVLTGGARDAPERHQTLRATIEWSYGLLDAPLQELFRRLSVFAGSFSLEAAESVAGADLDEVAALVDWNLLKPIGDGRFLMLETIREFARDLLEPTEEFDDVRDRHLGFFLALVLEAEPNLTGPEQRQWYDRLAGDHDNVREALAYACERGDGERALMLAGTIWRFWWNRGYTSEAGHWYERALALAGGASTTARARGEFGAAHVAESLGDTEETRTRFERAAELLREAGETRWLILALTHLAGAYRDLGDPRRGESLNAEALTLAEESRDARAVSIVKSNMAGALLEDGEDEPAAMLFLEALDGFQAIGDTYGVAAVRQNQAVVGLRRNDPEGAATNLREALRLSSSIGDTHSVAHTLALVVAAVYVRGDPYAAAMLAAADDALCSAHRFELYSLERKLVDESTLAARRALGDTFEQAWQAGAELDVGAAVELALTTLGS